MRRLQYVKKIFLGFVLDNFNHLHLSVSTLLKEPPAALLGGAFANSLEIVSFQRWQVSDLENFGLTR
jgi:hypothetical protein